MRWFSLLALASAAMLGTTSAADVDAGENTPVHVSANAWDTRTSGDGCSPDGCKPELTRDNKRHDDSRWSCKYDLADEDCEICFEFEEPQDIKRLKIAFFLGDTRKRSFKVELDGSKGDSSYEFTSSGTTANYENFYLYSDETERLCVVPEDLDDDEWMSTTEFKFMVEE